MVIKLKQKHYVHWVEYSHVGGALPKLPDPQGLTDLRLRNTSLLYPAET